MHGKKQGQRKDLHNKWPPTVNGRQYYANKEQRTARVGGHTPIACCSL